MSTFSGVTLPGPGWRQMFPGVGPLAGAYLHLETGVMIHSVAGFGWTATFPLPAERVPACEIVEEFGEALSRAQERVDRARGMLALAWIEAHREDAESVTLSSAERQGASEALRRLHTMLSGTINACVRNGGLPRDAVALSEGDIADMIERVARELGVEL